MKYRIQRIEGLLVSHSQLGTSCRAKMIPAATATPARETTEGKTTRSKWPLYAFPKSFPMIFQRISSTSEDSLGNLSPSFDFIRTSYMVSS